MSNIANSIYKRIATARDDMSKEQIKAAEERPPEDWSYTLLNYGLTKKFNLKPVEAILVSHIIALSGKRGYCYAGQKRLAKLVNVSIPTINTTLQKLLKRKILENSPVKSEYNTVKWKLGPKVQYELDYVEAQREKHLKRKRI